MAEPLALPIRVLVKGASTVVWTSWMGGPRTDFAYPRAIEAELLAAGRPAEVKTTAIASQRAKDAFRFWQHDVVMWSPDVVVLHYGHYECVHRFLPWRLERHAHSLRRRPGTMRELYRTYGIRPVWRSLSKFQAAVDRRLEPTRFWRRREQAVRDTEKLIANIRSVASPLVLVADIPPPGRTYREWFPGMSARVEAMNASMADMVARIDDPDVRVFSIVDTITPLVGDEEEAAPDGGHLRPDLHRAVGRAIAEVVLEWVAGQEHLALPSESASHDAR